MPRKQIVGVMGPDTPSVLALAQTLGTGLAEAGYVVLTGGRNRGVMAAACAGAKAAGGTTIGIIPGEDTSELCDDVDIPIVTGLGHARNNLNVLSSAVVVAVGMGPGTASEVALALKAGKPVVLLAASEEAEKFFSSLDPSLVHKAKDVVEALVHVRHLLAPPA